MLQYATNLDRRVSAEDYARWNDSGVIDWANESRSYALDHAYALPERGRLTKAYIQRSRAIMELRLAQAGTRLAHLLNDLLNGTHNLIKDGENF